MAPHSDYHVCDLCGSVLGRKSELTRHMKLHDPNEATKFKCAYCPKGFPQWTALENHKRHHTGERLPCPEPGCKSSYRDTSNVHKHRKSDHGYQPSVRRPRAGQKAPAKRSHRRSVRVKREPEEFSLSPSPLGSVDLPDPEWSLAGPSTSGSSAGVEPWAPNALYHAPTPEPWAPDAFYHAPTPADAFLSPLMYADCIGPTLAMPGVCYPMPPLSSFQGAELDAASFAFMATPPALSIDPFAFPPADSPAWSPADSPEGLSPDDLFGAFAPLADGNAFAADTTSGSWQYFDPTMTSMLDACGMLSWGNGQ